MTDSVSGSQVAGELQEAMLPRQVPVLPRVDVAATYVAPADPIGVGGDWLDVVPTPGGRVALVVGDVVGRGIEAVTVMSQLRAVLRDRLRSGSSVGEALLALDAFAADLPGAVASTACVALLDPVTGRMTYSTAGHPPPLVVGLDGTPRYLPRSGGGGLGTGSVFSPADTVLENGELLVLYTDGALDGRKQGSSGHPGELAELVAAGFSRLGGGHGIRGLVDSLCERTVADLVGAGGPPDDLAVLAVERMPPHHPLELALPAEPGTVRLTRGRLWEWLHELRVRDLDAMAMLHAVGEAVSNAVEHAYADTTPPADAVHLTAELVDPGEAVVVVRDRGRWREGGPSGRGRGLSMARGFADGLEVDKGPDGTTVTLRHRIGRPVRMFRSAIVEEGHHSPRTGFRTETDGAGRVSVHGPVDELSAEVLREDLVHWSKGGTASLVVDLSRVSFLGSVGVQLLAEALAWVRDDAVLELVVESGSPAQRVLETVGLPYGERRS